MTTPFTCHAPLTPHTSLTTHTLEGPDTVLRVASVPSSHVYVQHLGSQTVPQVVRLPDPTPAGSPAAGQWWPPRLLDPEWLLGHVDLFDVYHLHFGFDTSTPDDLRSVVRILRAHDKRFVFTVHDLHNPHFEDDAMHREQLDVLVPAADDIITLTAGAAAEIHTRWGRTASVLAHPHVVPLETMAEPRPDHGPFVIGIHAKNLRANLDPLAVVDTLVEAARTLPDSVVRLDIDEDVFDSRSHWYSPTVGAKLTDYQSFPNVDVRVHRKFSDAELWRYLSDIDVSVLPYRFGTHSGWLEACTDLGTAVIAPCSGYYSDQHHCETFAFGIDAFDPSTLLDAVHRVHSATDRTVVTATDRADQREMLARRHHEIYRGLDRSGTR